MSQFFPGWVDSLASAVKSRDEETRAKALGVKPRRCFRVAAADVEQSRRRGSARGPRSRYALKNYQPVEDDEE